MRTTALLVLGAPAATWAAYDCLAAAEVEPGRALPIALAWTVGWAALSRLAWSSRWMAERHRRRRGRGGHGSRPVWRAALLTSMLLPLPLSLGAHLLAALGLAPLAIVVPMLAMLALPVPLSLWWMAFWPAIEREEEILSPVGWRVARAVTPLAPLDAVPRLEARLLHPRRRP